MRGDKSNDFAFDNLRWFDTRKKIVNRLFEIAWRARIPSTRNRRCPNVAWVNRLRVHGRARNAITSFAETVGDAPARQVVRREFNLDAIAEQDANIIHAHFARDVRE